MPYIIPISDISTGNWSAVGEATLWECTDAPSPPTPNDLDHAQANNPPLSTVFEVLLSSVLDPQVSTNHTIRIRAQAQGTGQPESFDAFLYQGTTLIAQIFNNNNTNRGAYVNYEATLSAAQADDITDYTNLRVRVAVNNLGTGENILISQIHMFVPAPAVISKPRKNIFFTRGN